MVAAHTRLLLPMVVVVAKTVSSSFLLVVVVYMLCILFLLYVCGVVRYACVVTDGQDVCSPGGCRGYADQ